MKALGMLFALFASLALVGALSAKERQGGKPAQRQPAAGGTQILELLKGLNLSKQQMLRLQALVREYSPKFQKLNKKQYNILTAEQKKAMADARAEAVKAGKNSEEVEEAIKNAIKLTEEQEEAVAEVQQEMSELQREMAGKVLMCLTPEQREIIRQKLEQAQKRQSSEKSEKTEESKDAEKP